MTREISVNLCVYSRRFALMETRNSHNQYTNIQRISCEHRILQLLQSALFNTRLGREREREVLSFPREFGARTATIDRRFKAPQAHLSCD